MILPLIEGGTYGSWLTSIGLKVYDILASVEGDDKRKMLDKEEALENIKEAIEVCLEGDKEDVNLMRFVGIQKVQVERPMVIEN